MPNYKNARYTTTKEERVEMVLNKKKNSCLNNGSDKLTNYLSQENVKNFNMILVDKSLKTSSRQIFSSREECFEEVSGYFKLCNDYNIAPTIASLCVYIGMHRDTLYSLIKNNKCQYADILSKSVDICHAYLENGALSSTIAPLLFIFLGKNYYSLTDASTVNLTSAILDTSNTSNTMNIVREQLELENKNSKN